MDNDKKEYKLIIKSLSVLGSAQVLSLVVTIIRSKVVAIFLGPIGMGIAGLFNTTLELFSTIVSLGIDKSAVKEIASIQAKENEDSTLEIIKVIKRLAWYTGILGAVLMIFFSNVLSQLTFDSFQYSYAFIWLALALLFKQLCRINLSILQGLRRVSNLAKANVYGSIIGLVVSIPLYFYLEIKAIIPAIIITNLIALIVSYYYQNKIELKEKLFPFELKDDLLKGKEVIKLGVLLSFTGIVTIITTYIFQIYLTNITTLEIVGFYLAGIAILNYCVNIVFNTMSMDYYPRLAAIHTDNLKLRKAIQQQALIAILIITPIIVLFTATAPFLIKFLYSSKFLEVIVFVKWAILGMLFKAVSHSIGYAFIAKGDSKVFLKTTVFFNLFFLFCNVLGFKIFGLEGLGLSFLVYYVFHFISVFIIASSRYNFYFEKEFYRLFALSIFYCALLFVFSEMPNTTFKYLLMGIGILISIIFTLYYLNKKIDLIEVVKKIKK